MFSAASALYIGIHLDKLSVIGIIHISIVRRKGQHFTTTTKSGKQVHLDCLDGD